MFLKGFSENFVLCKLLVLCSFETVYFHCLDSVIWYSVKRRITCNIKELINEEFTLIMYHFTRAKKDATEKSQ